MPGKILEALWPAALLLCPLVQAQIPIRASVPDGNVNIFNTDMAVLEAGDVRKDLPCSVTPVQPTVGFDLRFHAGYDVNVPLRELAGSDNLLTVVFRITMDDHKLAPVYFAQHIRVPEIPENPKGDAWLQGSFEVGEGTYHVDWLMRDRSERVCSFYWDSTAAVPVKDRPMELAIAPGVIQRETPEQFHEEAPVQRAPESPLNVKVLVNFAPQRSLAPRMEPVDTVALVSILRSISRDPRIGKFSLVAFNMQEERVLYRQERADRIDFPALGKALASLNLGTIDLKRLGEKHGDTAFLCDLIHREVPIGGMEHPDALIFAGPKVMLDANVSQESLRDVVGVDYPVFYMNYNLNPQAIPWRDAISHTVKFLRGYEYTISKPKDLWHSVSDMVSRIVKSRNERTSASISSQ